MHTAAKREVTVIPATKRSVQNGGQIKELKCLRVAAYCRVSTGDESQQTSYTCQKAFYTGLINNREGWTMAGIYADEALSGTSRVKRIQFNRMMDDATAGKIDYIVTKSISRFARNTVDTLDCVRQLRQQNPPVGIYFEKENIDTLDAKGELILTILSALAQDESRSISDNIRWTFQKNFRDGKPQIDLSRMLGYDKGANGAWVINPEQAKTVGLIFERYLQGDSGSGIARRLNAEGRRTVNGNPWTAGGVFVVLRNEKYVGDLAMQKTITKDFLTHRSTLNRGEAPMYYVKDHHAGIVSRSAWDQVQLLLQQRGMRSGNGANAEKPTGRRRASPLVNLTCGCCGGAFSRMSYSAGIRNAGISPGASVNPEAQRGKHTFSYTVYRCRGKYGAGKGKQGRLSDAEREAAERKCASKVLCEAAIQQSFMETVYAIRRDYIARGNASDIERQFRAAYERVRQQEKNTCYSLERLAVIDAQQRELEGMYNYASSERDERMQADLKHRIGELKEEKRQIESAQGQTAAIKKNYDLFLQCILGLPDTNSAGMQLNVNGLDSEGCTPRGASGMACSPAAPQEMAKAPDYLEFARGLYHAFIVHGEAVGDTITYATNFGVSIVTVGNSRRLTDFLGFRRCHPEGSAALITECWQVNERQGKKAEKDHRLEYRGR